MRNRARKTVHNEAGAGVLNRFFHQPQDHGIGNELACIHDRLGALADIIRAYEALAAQHRGEITAEVTSAHPLTDDQAAALKSKLKAGLGRDVAVDLQVDPAILGGLVVKVGSRQIDSSIRTKLNSLAYAMKG